MTCESLHPALHPYRDKIISAPAAAALIRPGQHVFIGTGCAAPRTLVAALENDLLEPPADVELVHIFDHPDRAAPQGQGRDSLSAPHLFRQSGY